VDRTLLHKERFSGARSLTFLFPFQFPVVSPLQVFLSTSPFAHFKLWSSDFSLFYHFILTFSPWRSLPQLFFQSPPSNFTRPSVNAILSRPEMPEPIHLPVVFWWVGFGEAHFISYPSSLCFLAPVSALGPLLNFPHYLCVFSPTTFYVANLLFSLTLFGIHFFLVKSNSVGNRSEHLEPSVKSPLHCPQ